jgi:uncharacterized protein YgiM (DUF1202 family)
VRSVFIRQGPGTSFRTSGSLKRGDCIDINGRSEDNLWAQFNRGWTSTTNLTIEGDMQTLPVVPPPTPQP